MILLKTYRLSIPSQMPFYPSLSDRRFVSISVMEAMFYGLPLILTDVGSNGEIISEKTKTGFSFLRAMAISSTLTTIIWEDTVLKKTPEMSSPWPKQC